VQATQNDKTACLKSVTAEDTRPQAPTDVDEGEREAGSLPKSAGTQRRSSAAIKLSNQSDVDISTHSAKGTGSQAQGTGVQEKQKQGSGAAEKPDSSSEDDNDTHCRGVRQEMADDEMVAEAYHQGFNHYHFGKIAEHMEQMTIRPDANKYRPSNDENQRAVGSKSTAVCNYTAGQSSDESNVSQQRHSEYSSADECSRSKRMIESCSNNSSSRSKCNNESCSSDRTLEW